MALTDPIPAYNAENNVEAAIVQRLLESHGIEAYAAEDNSLVGHWLFGNLPEIHKPQVWISRADTERVAELLIEYERHRMETDASRTAGQPTTITVHCEDCGKASQFAESLKGSVQECSHCRAYIDVGDIEWPYDEGDAEESGDSDQ